ncbi:MAG: DoxX family protein [Phycisphaerae bacterium]
MSQSNSQPNLASKMDDSGVPLLLVRLIVGGTFVYLAYNKIADPVTFLKNINEYRMLEPGFFMNTIAITLPWIEMLAGIALILGVMIRGAALTAAGMLLVFTPTILLRAMSMMEEGVTFAELKFDCGCGAGPTLIWKKLLENSGLFIASLVALMSRSRRWCLSSLFTASPEDTLPEAESGISDVVVTD